MAKDWCLENNNVSMKKMRFLAANRGEIREFSIIVKTSQSQYIMAYAEIAVHAVGRYVL